MEEKMQKRRVKKRKKRGAWPFLLLLVIILLAVLAMSPVCSITEVKLSGNEQVADQTILDAAGALKGKNIFRISTGGIEKKVEGVPYIQSATVKRELPGRIRITVEECELCLFIPFEDGMLAVSRDGCAADLIRTDNAVGAPIAENIRVSDYEIGAPIETEDREELELALRFTDILRDHGLFEKTTAITPNPMNVTFVLGYHLTVEFGTESQVSYKMEYLKQILGEVDETVDGVVNIRSAEHATYRKGNGEVTPADPDEEGSEGENAAEETPQDEAEDGPTAVPEPE